MKFQIKKIVCIILSLVMLFCFIGCKSQKKDTSQDDPYANSEKISFYRDNIFNYHIVKASTLSLQTQADVKSTIFKKARELNKKRPTFINDTENYDSSKPGIYIGEVENALTEKCREKLNENDANYYDFVIMADGGSIGILANSDKGYNKALNYFVDKILVDIDSTIYEDYCYHYIKKDKSKLKLNNVGIMNYAIVCDDNPSNMVYMGCEELQKAIKEMDNFEIPIVCDSDYGYTYQIRVTETNIGRDEYALKFEGKTLKIEGGHAYSLNAAIHKFVKNLNSAIKKANKKKTINIPSTYSFTGKYGDDTYGTNGYKLVWADEFDGNKLDEHFWHAEYYEDNGVQRNKDAVSVKDGCALITCKPTKLTDGTAGYTGADVKGQNVNFNYGYFEARAKLPVGTGTGVSFWAVGQRTNDHPYSPEIDVIESFGFDNYIASNIHSWWKSSRRIKGLVCSETEQLNGHIQHLNNNKSTDGFSGGNGYSKPGITTMSDAFHTFGCEWTPTYIKFFMDGVCYSTTDITSNLVHQTEGYKMSEYMFFSDGSKMHLAFGAGLGATLDFWDKISDSTQIPSKYYIDYIHLYQMPGVGEIIIE